MRETVRSLRIYFILIGATGTAGLLLTAKTSLSALQAVFFTAHLIFFAALFYAGVRLRFLLQKSPRLVVRIVAAGGVLASTHEVLAFNSGGGIGSILGLLGAILLTAYLARNLRRLASEVSKLEVEPLAQ
jgi:hypothetical protein